MSARDEYMLDNFNDPFRCIDQMGVMCDEIDRLRAALAAVSAPCECGRRDPTDCLQYGHLRDGRMTDHERQAREQEER